MSDFEIGLLKMTTTECCIEAKESATAGTSTGGNAIGIAEK
jgi:hypothetical protein